MLPRKFEVKYIIKNNYFFNDFYFPFQKYSFDPKSNKLIRIITKKASFPELQKSSITKESFNDEFESDPKEQLVIQAYDVENEILFEFPIGNSILSSLDGISQVWLNNKLFICGASIGSINSAKKKKNKEADEETSYNQNSFSSSFMYSIDLLKKPISLSFEVNSCFLHYYPSLSVLRNEYIIVIGGKNSKKCEYYSNTNKKWKELPELPEERYGASTVCDNTYNSIYCFGGYDSTSKKNCMSIFKFNVNSGVKWETILAMENSESIAKQFGCIIKKDNGHCILLGGKNNKGQACDEIVDLYIKNKMTSITLQETPSLCKNLIFRSLRQGEENRNGCLYLFDDDTVDIVHKIDSKFSSIIKLNS